MFTGMSSGDGEGMCLGWVCEGEGWVLEDGGFLMINDLGVEGREM